MKILNFIKDNILLLITIFLLAFIPLYPKLPLFDVRNTWVYIRIEDFAIVFIAILWIILLFKKKISLKTPLTLPILVFWIIGAVSVLHAVLLIFPTLANVFPNVAFLSMLRRIEYIFLFFVAFSSIKSKDNVYYIVTTLTVVLILVAIYGIGQRFLGFPAFLTSNEEFAKGVSIQLSRLSRVPSTFAGHYDLAAYLVLVIPILTGSLFAFKNFLVKISLFIAVALGIGLIFMTVSRISVFALLSSLVLLLFFLKKRLVLVFLAIVTLVFLSFSPSIIERFGSTISEVDVLVNAKTGSAIGHISEVPSSYFEDKVVLRDFSQSEQDLKLATSSAIVPLSNIPDRAILLSEPTEPTGENLPQGTSYINLYLSPVTKKVNQYFYKKADKDSATTSAKIYMLYGDFLIKRAKAYDLSLTTRSQGEWPKAFEAFKRNFLLGSGYGSVTLAVDNNYLRLLAETGILGFISFLSIFIIAGIYIKKMLPVVAPSVAKSFALGFVAGTFGLFLNAILIDVFEASKIAFTYWLLMGITLGILSLYKKEEVNLWLEFKKAITSTFAIFIYLFVAVFSVFFPIITYYFVGDDFTWFRWISNCCSGLNGIFDFFTNADGFFYRPGTKLYFYLMHSIFWLNQNAYHLVSVFLHFVVTALVFMVSQRIFKNYFLSAGAALVFIILSGHHEAIFWISTTGFLFNAVFALFALLFFILWKESKRSFYFVLSLVSIVLSLLFHELGVVVPFLIILYDVVFGEKFGLKALKKNYYLLLVLPILPYLILRFLAKSHWFSGDYSYNLFNLPFNFVGNIIGYLGLSLIGPSSLPFYNTLRSFSKENLMITLIAGIAILVMAIIAYKIFIEKSKEDEKRVVVFGLLFFIISLLPFLGLGNITSRYSYLSSFGFAIIFVLLFKRLYHYLLDNYGKQIGLSVTILLIVFFGIAHLFQLQKTHNDWREAGEKSKKFIVSLEELYINEWRTEDLDFYFVNVPIRYGEAWVFPVGLSDLVWFVTQNENIGVYQFDSVSQALNTVGKTTNKRVLEFDNFGGLTEWKKTTSGTIFEVER